MNGFGLGFVFGLASGEFRTSLLAGLLTWGLFSFVGILLWGVGIVIDITGAAS